MVCPETPPSLLFTICIPKHQELHGRVPPPRFRNIFVLPLLQRYLFVSQASFIFTMVKFSLLHSVLPAVARVLAVSLSIPSPRDLFDDPCITFRLPPRSVNATYLNEASVEWPWTQPPFGFGYGKWALAWTSIEEYWDWSNMQVRTAGLPNCMSARCWRSISEVHQ